MENFDNKTSETTGSGNPKQPADHDRHEVHGRFGFCRCGKHVFCRCGHHGGFRILRFLVMIIIALIILCLGVSIGRHSAYRFGERGFHYRPYGQMMVWQGQNQDTDWNQNQGQDQIQFNGAGGVPGNMMWRLSGQTVGQSNVQTSVQANGQPVASYAQISGQIRQINGLQIVIVDASGNPEAITVTPDTVITAGNNQISFTSLKPGQTIIAAGALDQNQNLVAQIISVR